ncbi:4-alpha-glucanotransferase, chloroplastic/amyloplastic isoform X2 [Benincasa hispida]|uniref:4-alpha-glucanotransferase, chloroplastic/amyloplastic isoform X2 n=1 Tax=Benincasa hispida TaxID=102211 RepID=UPI00190140E1|nr:4-alpha-glucanotransferase, chloroplastic/amyloplastic isoform X2 [Benincasa hispida]
MAISTSVFPFHLTPKLRNPPLPLYATTTFLSTRRFQHSSSSSSTHTLKVSTIFDTVTVGEDFPVHYGEWFPDSDPDIRRRAGVLLHPTSFRGPYGIGDLGDEAFRFIDWLHEAGFSVWQVLPLVPPGRKANEEGSPYSGQDANCGNTLLISLDELVKDGLLTKDELPKPVDHDHVNFSVVADIKDPLIAKAAERLIQSDGELKRQLEEFCRDPDISSWLEDAAYFAAIDNRLNCFSWYEWPEPLKNRHLSALEDVYQRERDFINIFIAQQFLFQRQWRRVRSYANTKGITIMGDMPIYVGYQSADVWANKKQFLLNKKGFPVLVSGVPPDAFSETGQLWGSPLYDWKAMEKDGFSWWIRRIKRAQNLYDEFRIDHFRGFAGFWAVPSEAQIATVGRWKAGPGKSLFDAISRAVGKINIFAEDLLCWTSLSVADQSHLHPTSHLSRAFCIPTAHLVAIFGFDARLQVVIAIPPFHCSVLPIVVVRLCLIKLLGVITEDVVQLRKSIGAPGMAVLQFGFGSDSANPHLPHNHESNQVVYTGTHDNDTIRGWWDNLNEEEKSNVLKYLSVTEKDDIPWALIRAALSSVAQTAIIPLQDVLGLGSSARMNIPATQFGNWKWRIPSSVSFESLETEASKLKDMISLYGRL